MRGSISGGREVAVLVLATTLLMLAGVATAFSVYDSDDSTDTTVNVYRDVGPNITFIGNTLSVSNASSATFMNGSKTSIIGSFSNDELNVTHVPEARYMVNKSPNSPNEDIFVDVVNNDSNVTGRIKTPDESPGTPMNFTGTPEISVFYWLNGSEMPASAYETHVTNLTDMNLDLQGQPPENNERLYKLNVTGRDKYWIQVNASGFGLAKSAPRSVSDPFSGLPGVEKPRVNDVLLQREFFVQGTVHNKSGGDTSAGNISVRLEGMEGAFQSRLPFTAAPPVLTNITDSGGRFNFTGLAPGPYRIEITNSSATNYTYSPFQESVRIVSPSNNGDGSLTGQDLYFTSYTGNISGDIEGKAEGARYAVGVFNSSMDRGYIKPGVDPGGFTMSGIPNGSYQAMAARFEATGFEIASKDIQVNTSQETDVGTLRFPETVKFNATVYNGTSKAKQDIGKDAIVIVENQTEGSLGQTSTDSNGEISVNLINNTLHQVTIIPPPDSDFKRTETDLMVNETTRLNHNFSVKGGTALEGWIEKNGEGLNAEVLMWNRSKRSFGQSGTNSSGYYEIKGLEENAVYTVDVYTHEHGVGNNLSFSLETDAAGKVKRQDYEFTEETVDLGGNVTDTSGANIAGTVELTSPVTNLDKQDSFNTSQFYNFTDLSKNVFYKVRVEPDDNSYEAAEEFIFLDENKTLDFELASLEEFTATVKDSNGDSVGSGVRVVARNNTRNSFDSDVTDSNGKYALNLESGHYDLVALPPDQYSPAKKNVELGVEATPTFGLETSSVLEGNVTRESMGSKLGNGTIRVWNRSEEVFREETFSNGNYSVSGLKSGTRYNVWVESDNRTFQVNQTEAASGDLDSTFNVSLKLNTGRSMRVTVQDNDTSETLEDARVNIRRFENETDGSGNALFPRQPQGETISIAVEKDGYFSATKSIQVDSREVSFGDGDTKTVEYQNVTVEIENPRDVDVDFNVTKNGVTGDDAVSGALVSVRSNRTDSVAQASSGVTRSDGETTLEDVVPGDSGDYGGGYLVALSPDEDTVLSDEAWLAKGSTGKIDSIDGSSYTVMYEVPE